MGREWGYFKHTSLISCPRSYTYAHIPRDKESEICRKNILGRGQQVQRPCSRGIFETFKDRKELMRPAESNIERKSCVQSHLWASCRLILIKEE